MILGNLCRILKNLRRILGNIWMILQKLLSFYLYFSSMLSSSEMLLFTPKWSRKSLHVRIFDPRLLGFAATTAWQCGSRTWSSTCRSRSTPHAPSFLSRREWNTSPLTSRWRTRSTVRASTSTTSEFQFLYKAETLHDFMIIKTHK